MGRECLGNRVIKQQMIGGRLLVFISNVNSNMHFFLAGDAFDV